MVDNWPLTLSGSEECKTAQISGFGDTVLFDAVLWYHEVAHNMFGIVVMPHKKPKRIACSTHSITINVMHK